MLSVYSTFQKSVDQTLNVDAIYNYITKTIIIPFDCSDLLRWEFIQCVSAFDKLIHDFVRIGMLEIFRGQKPPTNKFKSFSIDYSTYNNMQISPQQKEYFFEQKIILNHSHLSFQDPAKVADALSYIWEEKNKWEKISEKMLMPKNICMNQLKTIINRRNQIVHESDYTDPFSNRQIILQEDSQEVRTFILKLGYSIYNCVK